MKNKEDWDKLEEWQRQKNEEKQERFGEATKKQKKVKPQSFWGKFKEGIDNSSITMLDLIVCIVGIIVVAFVWSGLAKRFNTNQNIEEDLERDFQTGMFLVSKETDEKGNGKYIFSLDENTDIKFNVIKENGRLSNDFKNRKFKYYFEKWESDKKEKFIIEENEQEKGILNYTVIYPIEKYEELEIAINDMHEFIDYVGNARESSWQYYVRKDELVVYPYNIDHISKEDALKEAKRDYVNNRQRNRIKEQGITEEVLDEYWRPDYLTVQINGEIVKDQYGYEIRTGYGSGKYDIFLTEDLLNAIPNVSIKKERYNIISFKYNGEEFTIENQTDLSKNEVRNILTDEEFEQVFQIKIIFDYANELAKIEI